MYLLIVDIHMYLLIVDIHMYLLIVDIHMYLLIGETIHLYRDIIYIYNLLICNHNPVLSYFITYHRVFNIGNIEQKLLTIPDHPS